MACQEDMFRSTFHSPEFISLSYFDIFNEYQLEALYLTWCQLLLNYYNSVNCVKMFVKSWDY